MIPRAILGFAVCLFLIGCDDSNSPLSDPQTSKADERLIGVWCEGSGDSVTYYHIGHAGDSFPGSMMWIVVVAHSHGKLEPAAEYVAFPAVLGDKTYLSMVVDQVQIRQLNDTGWKGDAVDSYTFFRYQVDGNRLTAWFVDEEAKERAINSGKIKGVMPWNAAARFTDTTENVARLVAEAGDSLWDQQEPLRLEKVDAGKKK